ncbi:MAG: STAS domain-containing protein [Gemmatimonadetes bacterium]|nr:STAS domain-containing protein [Gemmatimonadota bacterium]
MATTVSSTPSGVTIVAVDGQLIVANRNELKETVLTSLEAGDLKFVFDFTATGYIDSSGLGVLVSISKKIREAGGALRLAGLNEDLGMLFELTKLDTLFKICDTKETAEKGF